MVYYNEYNKRKEWPKKSSINCFWCCHTFTCPPCVLPTKLKGEVFHVYGNFCSKECAAAYNFESQDNHNYQCPWERYSLLNHLYSLIEEKPDLQVNLAPHRMTLEMFGGSLSIEEFRESFGLNKKYNAVDFAKIGSETIGGNGGGGRPDFAQAGGIESSKIDEALEKFKSLI